MSTHHSLDYIEFTVRDLAQAKQFYTDAFGWAFKDYGPTYAGIQGTEREVGGIEQSEDLRASGGGALAILYSDDLEASLEQVRASGGTISKEIFSFPGGRRFHFLDPSGNELAVWTHA